MLTFLLCLFSNSLFHLQADVVAQTKIVYQEKELLQLIHEHLLSKGKLDSVTFRSFEINTNYDILYHLLLLSRTVWQEV